MILKTIRFNRGIALFITLAMIFILSVIAFAFIAMTGQDYFFSRKTLAAGKAFYLAESGIDYTASRQVEWSVFPHNEKLQLGDGTIFLNVTSTTGGVSYEVLSTGEYAGVKKTISAAINADGGISNWKEY
jgi:hypothetical protein